MSEQTPYDRLHQAFERRYKAHYAKRVVSIETSPGWAEQIFAVAEIIKQHNESGQSARPVKIVQIKEKFGALRIATRGATDDIREAIRRAEDMSAHTCWYCGAPGKRRSDVYIVTTCDICEELREQELDHPESPEVSALDRRIEAHIDEFLSTVSTSGGA